MEKPRLIIFDVNETLLSLEPVKKAVNSALKAPEDRLQHWFSVMVHYSTVETLTGEYHSFGEIGSAALVMVAESLGQKITVEEAKQAIIPAMRSLPPYADVKPGLQALRDSKQFKMVTLTNSDDAGATAKLTKSGLINYFDDRFTVQSLGKYKPHRSTYQKVIDATGYKPSEILMVATHAWDLMGAKNAGLQTAFIRRPNTQLYPITATPDYIAENLQDLVKQLTATKF